MRGGWEGQRIIIFFQIECYKKEGEEMAIVRKNVVVEGSSGMLGNQVVFRLDRAGRTILSIRPHFGPGRVFTEAQLAQQDRFHEAAAYAKDAAQSETIYAEKAAGTAQSAYNVAVADWFHTPEVLEIDLSGYSGEPGETVRARVDDDVLVTQVSIVIAMADGTVVEQGEMSPELGQWYTYTTTADCPPGPATVVVTGLDLPGHSGTAEEGLTAPADNPPSSCTYTTAPARDSSRPAPPPSRPP